MEHEKKWPTQSLGCTEGFFRVHALCNHACGRARERHEAWERLYAKYHSLKYVTSFNAMLLTLA